MIKNDQDSVKQALINNKQNGYSMKLPLPVNLIMETVETWNKDQIIE